MTSSRKLPLPSKLACQVRELLKCIYKRLLSADLLTAPLTAIREEQEPWFRGIPQKAKDWMAEKIVDKLIVQQLDPENSSEDEDEEIEELEEVVVNQSKEASPEKLPSQKGLILFS